MFIFLSLFLLLNNFILFAGGFISDDEYSKMIYKNPRGIGCNKCHGERGEGKIISSFTVGNKKRYLIGPRINNISMKRFQKALKKGHKFMPKYYLTDAEKAHLYYYLLKQNKKGVNCANKK